MENVTTAVHDSQLTLIMDQLLNKIIDKLESFENLVNQKFDETDEQIAELKSILDGVVTVTDETSATCDSILAIVSA